VQAASLKKDTVGVAEPCSSRDAEALLGGSAEGGGRGGRWPISRKNKSMAARACAGDTSGGVTAGGIAAGSAAAAACARRPAASALGVALGVGLGLGCGALAL
jgi:hypothetical protein